MALDHIGIGVSDHGAAVAFYDRALKPLGVTRLFDVPPEYSNGRPTSGYGDERPWFWIAGGATAIGTVHIAFTAETRAAVDAFYSEALAAGGRDNGPPGPRPHYHPDYYGAFVIDLDGHNIEAVCRKPG